VAARVGPRRIFDWPGLGVRGRTFGHRLEDNSVSIAALDLAVGSPSRLDRGRLLSVLAIAALAMATVAVFFADPQQVPWPTYALGCLLLWIAALPMLLSLTRSRPHAAMGLVEAYAVIYFGYYGKPVFVSEPVFSGLARTTTMEAVPPALVLSAVGLAHLLFGYWGSSFIVRGLPRLRIELDLPRCIPWFSLASAVSLVFRIATFNRITSTAVYSFFPIMMGYLGMMSLAGLLLVELRHGLPAAYRFFFVAAVLVNSALVLAMGFLLALIMLLLPLFFIYFWERARWPWTLIVGCILFLAPLQVSKGRFREVTWVDDKLGALDRLSMFASVTADQFGTGRVGMDDVNSETQARTNFLGTLAYLMDVTPREVPYWDGYTFADLPWRLVPRIILPQRPVPNIGQEFPRRYGLVGYRDYVTSFNLAQLPELYINFGPVGVAVGMLFVGFLFRWLNHLTTGSSGSALIAAQLFPGMLVMEANFSPVFGGLLYSGLGLYICILALPRLR
jgi:hypothetical protein